jgi:ribosomal protein L37AE/L43A
MKYSQVKENRRAVCPCGNQAVKRSSGGYVCQRCINIESVMHDYTPVERNREIQREERERNESKN